MTDADSAFFSGKVPVLHRAVSNMQTLGPCTGDAAFLPFVSSPARYPSEFGCGTRGHWDTVEATAVRVCPIAKWIDSHSEEKLKA
jgi:hypothetical protein